MKHCGTRQLETERLILRRFEIDDALPMFENWASDPEVSRYTTWLPHESVEVTRALIAEWMQRYDEPDYYNWVMVLKATGEVIGNISVVRTDDAAGECELGYCMTRRLWGRGYMPEAARAVAGCLFESVGARRVVAKHDVDNPKSGRVMQKLGMTRLGVYEKIFQSNRGPRDAVRYAISREEWQNRG